MENENSNLKQIIYESLEKDGVIDELRTKLRKSIFSQLQEEQTKNDNKKKWTENQLHCLQLIQEFLFKNELSSTLYVLESEANFTNYEQIPETNLYNSDLEKIIKEIQSVSSVNETDEDQVNDAQIQKEVDDESLSDDI
ncbi:lish domain-containing protein fopnl [Anaeramoeba ignava]|uniref:Lish domain-containing protein fopnl n=1 Tax=Anaeramoeba ignava TaxID=1746090 RepID=A0A9Q0RI28_ANAIG|nr:lish domain-containing protein fopnl [Anaeramoeba ignava]